MQEKAVERKLVQRMQARGAIVWKLTCPGRQGVPDRIAIMPGGRVAFIELKTETGRLSPMQKATIEQMRKQGAEVYVVYGAKQAAELVDALLPPSLPGGKRGDD